MSFNRSIPFVGFHTRIADHDAVPGLVRLIEEGLAPAGINTLILEFNPGYAYRCYPEFSTGTLNHQDALIIKSICWKYKIRIIPLFQCLSHQSNFNARPWPLYQKHPEFLETPDVPAGAAWPDFYCHCWCASNDDLYPYIFDMMDELIDVFEPDAVHIGLDEVFDLGEDCCPRCRGKNKAALLARTVKILHDHLTDKGLDTMMWGDRLLNADKLGYHMWEADRFGMYPAFDLKDQITRDIMICDWHYDKHDHGYPSVGQFMENGFFTVPAVAGDLDQAKFFWGFCLEYCYLSRKFKWPGRLGGLLFTHWAPLTLKNSDELLSAIMKSLRQERVEYADIWSSAAAGQVIGRLAPYAGRFKKL